MSSFQTWEQNQVLKTGWSAQLLLQDIGFFAVFGLSSSFSSVLFLVMWTLFPSCLHPHFFLRSIDWLKGWVIQTWEREFSTSDSLTIWLDLLCEWQGPKHMGHLLFFHVLQQLAGLAVEQLEMNHCPPRIPVLQASSLTHCAVALAPHPHLQVVDMSLPQQAVTKHISKKQPHNFLVS